MARGARRSAWTAAAVAVATFGLVQLDAGYARRDGGGLGHGGSRPRRTCGKPRPHPGGGRPRTERVRTQLHRRGVARQHPRPGHPGGPTLGGNRGQPGRACSAAEPEAAPPPLLRLARSGNPRRYRGGASHRPAAQGALHDTGAHRTGLRGSDRCPSDARRPHGWAGGRTAERGAVPARPHLGAAARGHACRLRRQCQPRAAHAAGFAARLHRDPAGAGPQRSPPASASSAS